jgi:hypothetical protein
MAEREHQEQKAVEHLRRAVAMLDELRRWESEENAGSRAYALAADASTEIRDAIAAIGADPFFDDADA